MTPEQTRTYGFGPHLTRQPLLEAMLCLLASMAFHAASTLGMIFNRFCRDWHTDEAREVLPQETNSISTIGTNPSTVILGLVPRIAAASSWGTTTHSPEANNQDARHKADHDIGGAASPRALLSPVIPAEARKREEREPRSHTHHLSHKPLASGSRAPRASGVTLLACPKVRATA